MPLFSYTAKKKDGEEYEGSAEFPDRFQLFRHIREEGGSVISYHIEGEEKGEILARLLATLTRVKMHEKVTFAHNLSAMLSAGLALSRALDVLARQTKNKKLKVVLASIKEEITKGSSFSVALGKHPKVFSSLFTAMVAAGEESGQLAESLSVIAKQLEEAYNLHRKVKGAMMYPGIIIIAMIGIGVAMMVYVVPTLSATFASLGDELPTTTKIVIGISDFLIHNALLAIILVVSAVIAFIFTVRSTRGKKMIDLVVIHVPLINTLIKEANAARVARTLASLLSAGVDVVRALEITHDIIGNSAFRPPLVEAQEKVQKGVPMSTVFQNADTLYPPLFSELMAVGEETGSVAGMLERTATFYEDEVSQKTKDMSTIIEPFLMVVIGAAVGFFAISMITPIYSISNSI